MVRNHFKNTDLDFFDNLFERSFFNDFWNPSIRTTNQSRDSQVTETENDYQIVLVAPGIEKEYFNVIVESDKIILGYDASNSDKSYASASKYNKSYGIPAECDIKKISALHENGILKVVLPKLEKAKPRHIKIA